MIVPYSLPNYDLLFNLAYIFNKNTMENLDNYLLKTIEIINVII